MSAQEELDDRRVFYRTVARIDHVAEFPHRDISVLKMRFGAFRGPLRVADKPFLTLVVLGGGRLSRPIGRNRREDVVVSRGRYGLVLPGDSGSWAWDGLDVVNIGFSSDMLAGLRDEETPVDLETLRGTAPRIGSGDRALVAALADALDRRLAGGHLDPLFVEGAILMLLGNLGRRADEATRRRSPLTERQLRRIDEVIRVNLDRPISVEELARAVGYSRFHFLRAFRTAVGETPYRFVTRRRIERAKELLATTAAPVGEIALAVGFATPGHFTGVFRNLVGTVPSEWRREGGRGR